MQTLCRHVIIIFRTQQCDSANAYAQAPGIKTLFIRIDDFPSATRPGSLFELLLQAVAIGVDMERFAYCEGQGKLVAVLQNGTTRTQLEAVQPDFGAMLALPLAEIGLTGVIICCRASAYLMRMCTYPAHLLSMSLAC